ITSCRLNRTVASCPFRLIERMVMLTRCDETERNASSRRRCSADDRFGFTDRKSARSFVSIARAYVATTRRIADSSSSAGGAAAGLVSRSRFAAGGSGRTGGGSVVRAGGSGATGRVPADDGAGAGGSAGCAADGGGGDGTTGAGGETGGGTCEGAAAGSPARSRGLAAGCCRPVAAPDGEVGRDDSTLRRAASDWFLDRSASRAE